MQQVVSVSGLGVLVSERRTSLYSYIYIYTDLDCGPDVMISKLLWGFGRAYKDSVMCFGRSLPLDWSAPPKVKFEG